VSFVRPSIFEADEATTWRAALWEEAFRSQNLDAAQDLLRRTDASAREVLAALGEWMHDGSEAASSAKRCFFNSVVGVHPEDREAHEQLGAILAEIQTGTCEVKSFPGADVGTWLVVNSRNQPIAVFKAGERRAFMEITARRVAFTMGLQRWVVPATIGAIEGVKIPLPAYDRLPLVDGSTSRTASDEELTTSGSDSASDCYFEGDEDQGSVASPEADSGTRASGSCASEQARSRTDDGSGLAPDACVDAGESSSESTTESDESDDATSETTTSGDSLDAGDESLEVEAHLARLRPWKATDKRTLHLVEELSVETFSCQRKVLHPDRADPRLDLPEGDTTGAIVGVLMPYLREPIEVRSLEDYDASFVGLTATACLLGLGDAKEDGIIDDQIVDAEMMMPAYLEPPVANFGGASRVRCIASCSVAYQQSKMSNGAQAAAEAAGESAPVLQRGHRLGGFPEQLRKAVRGWDIAADQVMDYLSQVRPVFFDRGVEQQPEHNPSLEDVPLMLDSNGVAYHLESLHANRDHTPAIGFDEPAFNADQVLAFHRRAEAVRSSVRTRQAEEMVKKVKSLIEPLKLVAEVDPVAREQLLQYEVMRRRHELGILRGCEESLDRHTRVLLERAPLTIGTVGSPVGWSQPWEEALARSSSVESSSPSAQLTPTLRATLEEVLHLLSESPAGMRRATTPRDLSGTDWLDSPVFALPSDVGGCHAAASAAVAPPPEMLQAPIPLSGVEHGLHKPAPMSAGSFVTPALSAESEPDEEVASVETSGSSSPTANGTVSAFKPSPKRHPAPASDPGRGGRRPGGARTLSFNSSDS
jgi:hypothetical protein